MLKSKLSRPSKPSKLKKAKQRSTAKIHDTFLSFVYGRSPDNALSLYNVLAKLQLSSVDDFKYCTLRDPIFTDRDPIFTDFRNDVAFRIGNRIVVLTEWQTTLNPNMPIRFIPYAFAVIEPVIKEYGDGLYGTKPLVFPTVEFIVLYDGEEDTECEWSQRLSDLVANEPNFGKLEIEVKVINIRHEDNADLVKREPNLHAYIYFIERMSYWKTQGVFRDEAIGRSVADTKAAELWTPYLSKNESEVFGLLTMTFDKVAYERVTRQEAMELGAQREREIWEVRVAERDACIADRDARIAHRDAHIAKLEAELAQFR